MYTWILSFLISLTLTENHYSGGTTTNFSTSNKAFSLPLNGLSGTTLRHHSIGNSFFNKNWITAPASATSRDGLGPLYNARSCSACHLNDGKGYLKSPLHKRAGTVIKLQNNKHRGDPTYGVQFSEFSINGTNPEINYSLKSQPLSPFRRLLSIEIDDLYYGALDSNTHFSIRLAPPVFGLGLLQAIDEEDILSHADPDDLDQDGISGRPNLVWNHVTQQKQIGRFGFKASQPDLRHQTADAFNHDMGLTSSLFPEENFTPTQRKAWSSIHLDPVDVSDQVLERVTTYLQTLSPPARRNANDPTVLEGERIFHRIGCAQCHIPQFTTSEVTDIPLLSNQVIHPYTDLLLHDMGPGLADGFTPSQAEGSEWRTPPLWGIGLQLVVSNHNHFLHDGRARNIREAILWHGGEAHSSKRQYEQLSHEEYILLHKFLESL